MSKRTINKNIIRFFSSKNSGIYHCRDCSIIKSIKPENLVGYGTQTGVKRANLRPCTRCIQQTIEYKILQKLKVLKEEKKTDYINLKRRMHNLSQKKGGVSYESGDIFYINTTLSLWYFHLHEQPIKLYHQNYKHNFRADVSLNEFHLQKKNFENAEDIITYVFRHDKCMAKKIRRESKKLYKE